MRVIVDTNVFISAILFPNSVPAKLIEKVIDEHSLVLCSYVLDELHRVFGNKFKDKLVQLERFLSNQTTKCGVAVTCSAPK